MTAPLSHLPALTRRGRPKDPDAWLVMSLLVDTRIEFEDGTVSEGMTWLDAERAIAQGFDRAPNAAYPLVQTVLVQDEALKRANARIEELEAALAGEPQPSGGFLENMRDSMFGREPSRGSVPSVRGSGMGTSGVWNTGPRPDSGTYSGTWG